MLNARMKPCDLYVNEPVEDSCGHLNDNWVYVDKIMAAIGFLSSEKTADDIRYRDIRYTALTRFKGLAAKGEYKLICQDREYIIKSINELARLSQYLLQEVL